MSDSDIIDKLGGTFRVAEICQVKPPSVSGWRNHGIPAARRQYLQLLRPDAFRGDAANDDIGPGPEEDRDGLTESAVDMKGAQGAESKVHNPASSATPTPRATMNGGADQGARGDDTECC